MHLFCLLAVIFEASRSLLFRLNIVCFPHSVDMRDAALKIIFQLTFQDVNVMSAENSDTSPAKRHHLWVFPITVSKTVCNTYNLQSFTLVISSLFLQAPARLTCYSCGSSSHVGESCPSDSRAHLAAERSGDMRAAQREREAEIDRANALAASR